MQENSYNNVYRPEITLQSVLQKSNIIELPKIAEIAGQLGVDRIKGFNLTISNSDFLNESLLFNQELSNEYLQRTKEVAKKYNLETKYQDPFDLNLDVFDIRDNVVLKRLDGTSCDFLWRQFNVGVEGEVRPCCHPNSPVLGNVYNNTVREIWNNRNYTRMRERFNSHNPLKCCTHCAMRSMKVLDASAFINESIL
jgi:radical SAM protein with 4Fe4S-binding SPASM domain